MGWFVQTRLLSLACLSFLGGFLIACGATDAPSLGEWTLQEDALTLTEDLQVSETEAFFFGAVTDLDVTSDGRIVVADREAHNVKILRPDGTLIDTLGRQGEGPGEFQMLRSIQAARGDSLYVFDPQRSRLTVFEPESPYEVGRILTFSQEEGFVTEAGVLDDHLVGAYGSRVTPEGGLSRPTPYVWRLVSETGTPEDSLILARRGQRVISELENNMFRIYTLPFRRTTAVALGQDGRLYHGWTDSLHIEARTPNGSSDVVASVSASPVPIGDTERDSVLARFGEDRPPVLQTAMPETKPAFYDLVVADDGRLWVQRPAPNLEAEERPWWVLDPEAQTISEVHLPRDLEIEVVQDGFAYGTTTTDMGAPAIVRYRVETDSRPT